VKAASRKRKNKNNSSGFFEKTNNNNIEREPSSHIRTLLPDKLFFCLAFISLAVPNLIFSGISFFDTLHIMKWVFAMTPVAVMAVIGGLRLLSAGIGGVKFKLDAFAKLWFVMLLYATIQPLWADITSWSTFIKEWFFFSSLVGMYIFSFNMSCSGNCHKIILWGANVNAALNVVFAELLIRNTNAGIPFIMNVPLNYIGNTGQQEMFGLWMAMTLMNGLYLHVTGGGNGGSRYAPFLKAANLALVAVNSWGLWNSTARGGFLSLLVGIVILGIMVLRNLQNRDMFKRVVHIAAAIIAMLIVTLAAGHIFEFGRAASLVSKTEDMLINAASIGGRRGIWQTGWTMIKDNAAGGVGIGHFKWRYLEAQQKMLQKHPEADWIFTFWAHSEYIQWFAEFGLFGIIFLLAVAAWWLWCFVRAVALKKALSLEAVWASSMLFLIMFDAVFSRPFHRIENVLWAAFAFAIVNREILPPDFKRLEIKNGIFYRVFGLFIAVTAFAGLLFLGAGIHGDRLLRSSFSARDANQQSYKIQEAMKRKMVRDEAEEVFAYHLISVAESTKKGEDWNRAVAQLYRSFKIRPSGRQLIDLVKLSRQLGYTDIFRELLPLAQRPLRPQDQPLSGVPVNTSGEQ